MNKPQRSKEIPAPKQQNTQAKEPTKRNENGALTHTGDLSTQRRAIAGLAILNGKRLNEALTEAGYAESTVRNATRNGLSAQRCIEAAALVYPMQSPGQLVTLGRLAMRKKLSRVLESEKALDATRVGELAKATQILEHYYGSDARDPKDDARQFVDRLEWLQQVAQEMQARRSRTLSVDALPLESTPAPEKE